ncbi:MAG: enoyl-CoA hydratase-related protein [Candidatus Methanomethylicia archaeon]
MNSYKTIIIEKKEGVMKITLNRPRVLNAINTELITDLSHALDDADKDKDVRVIVITGAGDRAFSAGADISSFMELKSVVEAREFARKGFEMVIKRIESIRKPVIAMVNGLALGGGCELAMACDIIVASDKAVFGQPEINVGVLPGWGGMSRLARLVGIHKAKELAFTGDLISAIEAEKIGLINKVVPLEKLEEEVMKIANKLKDKSPIALQIAKETINRSFASDIDDVIMRDVDAFAAMFATEDSKEGVKAFLEKRKPEFKGK